MKERIRKELEKRIEAAKRKGKCAIDLEMKKKVIDTQDNGLNDQLFIAFPTKFDNEFSGNVGVFRVSEYSEDKHRRFNSLEEVAEWIIETYLAA